MEGANVNDKSNNGDTSLIIASSNGDREIVKLLLNAGSDINSQNNSGTTALMEATWNEDPRLVEILLNAGADVNIANYSGSTPVDIANSKKNPEIIVFEELYHLFDFSGVNMNRVVFVVNVHS